jgi:hypothetical protein
VVRRLEIIRKSVERYSWPKFHYAFMLISIFDEPKSVGEAIDSIVVKLWKDSMVKEMESLHKNETWDLVKLPIGRKPIGRKWVFKKKMNGARQVDKFKARLVEKGYSQVKGVDFGEIFSPVAKLSSIRVIMSLAITFDIEIKHMNVKTMFLHGDLEEEMYLKQLEGFVVKGKQELVCKPKISLYSLMKSPRMWSKKFDTYILSFGFMRSKDDHYIYCKEGGTHFIYVSLYVDDMLLIENNMDAIKEVKKHLSSKFDMKDLGETNFILGMDIKRDQAARKIWLNKTKHIETVLKWFNMQDYKPMKVPILVGARLTVEQCPKTQEEIEKMACVPYESVVGSIIYAMVWTRLDIFHAVGVLSRYMLTPVKVHWTTIKRVFKYLCGMKDYAICYQGRPRGDCWKIDCCH